MSSAQDRRVRGTESIPRRRGGRFPSTRPHWPALPHAHTEGSRPRDSVQSRESAPADQDAEGHRQDPIASMPGVLQDAPDILGIPSPTDRIDRVRQSVFVERAGRQHADGQSDRGGHLRWEKEERSGEATGNRKPDERSNRWGTTRPHAPTSPARRDRPGPVPARKPTATRKLTRSPTPKTSRRRSRTRRPA